MTRRRYEINCLVVGGVPSMTAKVARDTTAAFIEHMRLRFQGSFSITFNAGVDNGWAYDSCSAVGADAEAALTSFRPPIAE